MNNTIDQIRTSYENLISNFETFVEKHNNSAGTRARKNLLELKKLSHELRKQISEEIASRKSGKSPTKKTPSKKTPSPAKKTPSKKTPSKKTPSKNNKNNNNKNNNNKNNNNKNNNNKNNNNNNNNNNNEVEIEVEENTNNEE